MAKKKTGRRIGSFDEEVDMPSGEKFLVVTGKSYLIYNETTDKHEIRRMENVFRFDSANEKLKDCYSNEVILEYDADQKTIFEYKLKGRTEPDYPGNP